MTTFHVYCDESCHLERDGNNVMLLGSLWCPAEERHTIARALRDLKIRHGLKGNVELKWTKVSPAKLAYYKDVLDFFFDTEALRFRAVVVPDKTKLRHESFAHSHDDFYYKLHFLLLRHWLDTDHQFRVFLDIKDTRSWEKTKKLHEVLANSKYDFDRKIVTSIELVRSDQVELTQLADFLLGIVGYANRRLLSSAAKLALVEHARHRSGRSLTRTTLVSEPKMNIILWRANETKS